MKIKEEILEITSSLAAGSLTLFLGTGFSKYMTDSKAPSWLELLYESATKLDENKDVINELFEVNSGKVIDHKSPLTICAQILEEEFLKKNKDIRIIISEILKDKINIDTLNNIMNIKNSSEIF